MVWIRAQDFPMKSYSKARRFLNAIAAPCSLPSQYPSRAGISFLVDWGSNLHYLSMLSCVKVMHWLSGGYSCSLFLNTTIWRSNNCHQSALPLSLWTLNLTPFCFHPFHKRFARYNPLKKTTEMSLECVAEGKYCCAHANNMWIMCYNNNNNNKKL